MFKNSRRASENFVREKSAHPNAIDKEAFMVPCLAAYDLQHSKENDVTVCV